MVTPEDLKNNTFLGIVEDNDDPLKIGRCRIRVFNIFDSIPVGDIPWASPFKDLNGNAFNVPDKGKILTVTFDNGNIYTPEYIYAQHYNANLKQKLSQVSGDDYLSLKALVFDEKTQIYVNDADGLKMDYKFNNINIKDSTMDLNLKDNFGLLNLGDLGAGQSAMLGDHWMIWFDEFVQHLLGSQAGPYLGNLGAPVVPNPAFIALLAKYQAIRQTFLSLHVKVVDNNQVAKKNRINIGQKGDNLTSTSVPNEVEMQPITFRPQSGIVNPDAPNDPTAQEPATDQAAPPSGNNPSNDKPPINKAGLDNQPELQKIMDVMKQKGYKVFDRVMEPNMVGVRSKAGNNPKVTNQFDETMHFFYKDEDSNWVHRKYTITTNPGFEAHRDPTTKKYVLSGILPNRVAVLAPGQYVDYYQIGTHKTYTAMVAKKGNIPVYRQAETNFYNLTVPLSRDAAGINIHKSGSPQAATVFNYSEGCQVFKLEAQFNEFMTSCKAFKDRYNTNSFTYTLLIESELA